jgi:hypothetical protein
MDHLKIVSPAKRMTAVWNCLPIPKGDITPSGALHE